MKTFPALIATAALAALTGCISLPEVFNPEQSHPLYTPTNYRGDAKLAPEIQRVAFLPIHGGEVVPPETAAGLDPVLVTALQHQMRFEVVVVSRADCQHLFGSGDFSSTAALPHGFLEKIAEKYAVDAVLFTDLTVYHPYRPLALGLRAKLAMIRDVRLVWAFDEVFSAADEKMVNTVRRHYREGDRSTPAVLQSPARFGAVAAEVMFRTLPAR